MLKRILLYSIIICSMVVVGCTKKEEIKTDKINNNIDMKMTKNNNDKINNNDKKENKKQKNMFNKKENFYGIWRINEFLNTSNVGTYSIDDLQKIIGSKITLSKKIATCFGDEIRSLDETIDNPVYKKRIISREEFEKNNKNVTFKELGIIGNSVEEVFVKGKNYNCNFYIKDDNTLILSGGGAYLKLIKVE